ncbi:MAG: serine/threonine protein kinase [Verrucomicrobia bacterium]|nr:serine/threonine protein kinase [Verrucomicrobiota bacterium]
MRVGKLKLVPDLSLQFDNIGIRLLRVLAEGGMGIVYEAEQRGYAGFHKRVAVKVIRDRYSAHEAFRGNFVGEACLVATMRQANIVQILQLGELNGRLFMVMELVEGVTLEEFILQHRALGIQIPVELAAFIVSRVCRGLAYVHGKKGEDGLPLAVVHRDVNPRNILLSHEGEVKLTDFGIAKARSWMYSEEGTVVAGKSEYLSPEQVRKEVTDARADIFSCGVVLAEMICGENPFEAETSVMSRRNIVQMPAPDVEHYRPGLDPRWGILCGELGQAPRRAFSKRFGDAVGIGAIPVQR